MKIVEKDWGQQVWLNDHQQILLMQAGGQTSLHHHQYHTTALTVVKGTARITLHGKEEYYDAGCFCGIRRDEDHRIIADTDCVIYEEYWNPPSPARRGPEMDIVRVAP